MFFLSQFFDEHNDQSLSVSCFEGSCLKAEALKPADMQTCVCTKIQELRKNLVYECESVKDTTSLTPSFDLTISLFTQYN